MFRLRLTVGKVFVGSVSCLVAHNYKRRIIVCEAPVQTIQVKPIVYKKQHDNMTILSEISKRLKDHQLLVIAIVLVTGATAAINIATPLVIGKLITVLQDVLAKRKTLQALNAPALKLVSMFLSQGVLTWLDITLITRLGDYLSTRLRSDLFHSLLYQDIAFFDSHLSGELMNRFSQDVSDFKHSFKLTLTQGLKASFQITGSIYTLFSISPNLTLKLLLSTPLLYVGMNMYGSYLRLLSNRARSLENEAAAQVSQALSNIRVVRSFSSEDDEIEAFKQKSASASRYSNLLGFHIGLFQGLTNFSVGGMVLFILYYGGNLVGQGKMSGGELMAYLVTTQAAQKSLTSIGKIIGQAMTAFGSAHRIFEYILLEPEIPIKGGYSPRYILGKLEFRNVSFNYPSRPDQTVLDEFNLSIPAGAVVAFCGSSGAGKSTVGQLIERFYDPKEGSVYIDGLDIKSVDPQWLRSHIGYILQEPALFSTTIYENIRYGNPNATREQVLEAAKQANCDFIETFPEKYDTIVGDRGVTLSGGQRQRISIARAFLKNPKILILDEATSALDPESEKLVQDALDNIMQGRTTIVIAHRLSTIKNADTIVVMGGGKILEMGSHETLMKLKGHYYAMSNHHEI